MEGERRPYRALLSGVLLPGLGHLYAGDRKTAMGAFLSVTLCLGLGFALVGDRLFAFTGHPVSEGSGLRPLLGWIPLHCWPEIGNLGEMILCWIPQIQEPLSADTSRLLRLPREWEHAGLTLAAMSGPLNLIFAADASWLVARAGLSKERNRPISGRPAFSVLLGWMVPGLGHLREGRRATGLLVGACLLGLWFGGLWLSAFAGVDRAQLYWWWAAQSGMGGPTFLGSIFLGPVMVTGDVDTMDLGVTLLAIAGLMNYVVLTDVYTLAERKALTRAGILEPTGEGA